MKGLTMLTVVINALVQQEEMVTVITCFYNVFEFTEFPRTGMCTTPNSSTNQGPRAVDGSFPEFPIDTDTSA